MRQFSLMQYALPDCKLCLELTKHCDMLSILDADTNWLSTLKKPDIDSLDNFKNLMIGNSDHLLKKDWLDQCFDGGRRKPDITDNMAPTCGTDNDTKGEHIQRCRTASKPHSTPLTLKWLEENYEVAEGVCIPRNALYMHYLDYCNKNDTQPVNAASFGKIIRQQFSHITTRRLGTRGQSKYHYYGIGVKETSAYYDAMYSSKNVQGYGNGKREPTRQMMAYSPRSKLGTLLPDFPDIKDLKLPPNIPEDKVLTFLMMYRTHCQRILDTVIRANFDEIQNFLVHFWQGMPQHMAPLLGTNAIVTLVGVCDSILYKAIANVLMPSVLQALPESLTQVIRKFARQLDDWLNYALYSLPENLRKVKFDLARRFCQVLRRQTSLNHLCQAARTVTQNPDITGQMVDDWMNIDLSSIVKQTLYTMDHYSEKDHQTIANWCREFERLLEEQAPIECFLEWLDTMVDRCVVKPSSKQTGNLRTVARQFLLMWSCFGTRVIRDMTLQSSPSFGSFHLLHLMFDDYVLYLVENLHSQERVSEFLRNIRQGDTSIDFGEELMPSTPNFSDGMPSPSETMTPPVVNPTQRPMERCSVITNGRDVMNQVGGTLQPDYTCQRNTEVTSINSSHSPVDDNSQVSIKSPYSPAADSGRSSNPSLQNTLTPTPVNHIAGPTYQQCQPYHMAYGQTITNQHTATMETQNSHPMYGYDVSAQYSRHYLSAAAAASGHHAKTDVTSLTPAGRQSVAPGNVSAEWPADSNAGNNRYGTPVMPHESVLRVNDNTNYSPYQAVRTPTYDYAGYAYSDNYPRTISNSTPPETASSHSYHHGYTGDGGPAGATAASSGGNSGAGNTGGNGHVSDYYDDGRTEYGSVVKRKYEHHPDASRHYNKRYHSREQYPPYHVTSDSYM